MSTTGCLSVAGCNIKSTDYREGPTMTSTTIPTDPTKLPWGPADRIDITPQHLSITGLYDSGACHSVHLVSNGDLGVMLQAAELAHPGADVPPHNVEDAGLVVISLGVDGGDHDQVHYEHRNAVATAEILTQAIEALLMCRDAVKRVSA